MFRGALEPWHLLVVAVLFILLFGARKLPDTARALGKSMRILKSEAKAMKDDGTAQSVTDAQAPSTTPAHTEAAQAAPAQVVAQPTEHTTEVR
jgi:sec-independent protein translocase protein TatA